jgi:molecular chaperone GrpE
VDLFTLVGQFTALRHEVNLQTKASRAAVEQNAEVLRQLAANQPPPGAPDDELRPLLKAVLDVADVLALSLRQMERLRESVEPLLTDLGEPGGVSPPEDRPRPGFFARLFGSAPARNPEPTAAAKQAAGKLRQLVAAAADGYAMSLRRVERVLPTFGLDPIPCLDKPFDPERMEVVEVVADTDRPPGTVVEEVRPGYTWRGKVFRFAQVKVAR